MLKMQSSGTHGTGVQQSANTDLLVMQRMEHARFIDVAGMKRRQATEAHGITAGTQGTHHTRNGNKVQRPTVTRNTGVCGAIDTEATDN